MQSVAMKLSSHSAAGLDQTSPLHYKCCWETKSAPALNAVVAFIVSHWAAGKMPSWAGPYEARARLIGAFKDALRKDARPIAIGLAATRFFTCLLYTSPSPRD